MRVHLIGSCGECSVSRVCQLCFSWLPELTLSPASFLQSSFRQHRESSWVLVSSADDPSGPLVESSQSWPRRLLPYQGWHRFTHHHYRAVLKQIARIFLNDNYYALSKLGNFLSRDSRDSALLYYTILDCNALWIALVHALCYIKRPCLAF